MLRKKKGLVRITHRPYFIRKHLLTNSCRFSQDSNLTIPTVKNRKNKAALINIVRKRERIPCLSFDSFMIRAAMKFLAGSPPIPACPPKEPGLLSMGLGYII